MKIREETQGALILTVMRVLDHEGDAVEWSEVLEQAQVAQGMLVEDTHSQDGQSSFDGSEYNPGRDDARLGNQLCDIFNLMSDGRWRTIQVIARRLNYPENSVQAQLRHLRKAKHGAWIVTKKKNRERSNLFYYQMRNPDGSRLPPVRPNALRDRQS